jgi:uncharacterized membrane protein YphA (DoxX/SURF4 family)
LEGLTVELVARLALAAVLLWAAAAKARGPRAAAGRFAAAGVPPAAALPAVAAVVAVEAALGVALLLGLATTAAAAAAAALGLAFAAFLLRARARGKRVLPCGCFGSDRERPVGLLVARALGLAALAALVLAPTPSPSLEAALAAAVVALALAVAVLAALLLALYRQVGVLLLRVNPQGALELDDEGPPLGRGAPALEGLRGRGVELVWFTSPDCSLCRTLAPSLAALGRGGLAVHTVADAADLAVWNVPGTPFAVQVIDGIVASKGTANTLEQLESLLATGRQRMHAVA